MSRRIYLIIGSTETLGYFSKQIGAAFSDMGEDVFYWDMTHPSLSRSSFEAVNHNDGVQEILITFNFLGLCGEGQCSNGIGNIWDQYNIEKLVILVDSPTYYYRQMASHMQNLHLVCIDKYHSEHVLKWHPEYGEPAFLPLAGNLLLDDYFTGAGFVNGIDRKDSINVSPRIYDYPNRSHKERSIDVLFTGNYVSLDSIQPSLNKAGPEYIEFLYDIAEELIKHPEKPLERTLLTRLQEEFQDEEEDMFPEAMFHMVFVDLYVRTYFRGNAIRTLANNGIKVHCVGMDWDKLEVNKPENVIHTGRALTSVECARAMNDSRISFNIMPWFKAGAHDRIFTSMLAGCATVTDGSEYLNQILTPWYDHAPFELGNDDSLLNAFDKLLSDESYTQEVANCGRHFVKKNNHTWESYAKSLNEIYNAW